jgi:hypothetical protein
VLLPPEVPRARATACRVLVPVLVLPEEATATPVLQLGAPSRRRVRGTPHNLEAELPAHCSWSRSTTCSRRRARVGGERRRRWCWRQLADCCRSTLQLVSAMRGVQELLNHAVILQGARNVAELTKLNAIAWCCWYLVLRRSDPLRDCFMYTS